jgi:hypothetical protein
MAAPMPAPCSAIHPEHDAVGSVVRSWYNSSFPEIGINGSADWFGFACKTSASRARVVLSIADPAQVPSALAAANAACAAGRLTVRVDDRGRAARLDAALRAHGCRYAESVTYLALTGPMASTAANHGQLAMAQVEPAELGSWARVKLQAFGNSEEVPPADAIGAETAARRGELALAEYQLGIVGGEPVAVLAHYPGQDDLVFVLGTRTPYRHHGIASDMLASWVAATPGARSHLINATDGGAPAALYRRLGFVDEVYWYSEYELSG